MTDVEQTSVAPSLEDRLAGCLLGGAVGDALGLPLEGLARCRARKISKGSLRYRFIFGRGMVSDDTEHACLTAVALAKAKGDINLFEMHLARGMRSWLCTVPAGVGLATLKATAKLMVGISPKRSGVRSAGNGPAMRASIIGAYFRDDPEMLDAFVKSASQITHADPRAITGAQLIAREAAGLPSSADPERRLDEIQEFLRRDAAPAEFADSLGLQRGVTGYILHTVPVAIYCFRWASGNYRRAVTAAAELGGDTDTLCAIVGGIAGARFGASSIPAEWLGGLWEWPRSPAWMNKLARSLANQTPLPKTFWPGYALRSPLFIAAVLAHGFRRLLPPY